MDRAELRRRGDEVRARLFGAEARADELGFDALMAELVYGSLWTRPGLTIEDRVLVTLSALCVTRQFQALRRFVAAALNVGIAPLAVVETVIQCGIYAGFSTSNEALAAARDVFAARGAAMPTPAPRTDALETLTARGHDLMATLHDSRRHDAHAAPDNPVTASLYPLVIQYCYGEIWDRPGLDRRVRALVAVAGFAALGHDLLLGKFARSALNVGATEAEVVETIIQAGPYAGFAFALKALTIASDAFGRAPP
jgi:4-carboxymuconolactone decarboxylase